MLANMIIVFPESTRPKASKKKTSEEPRPAQGWRNPETGNLFFDVEYDHRFQGALKGFVPGDYRYWHKDLHVWEVGEEYALSVEDLLEAFYPDIVIDYQGWPA